MVRAEGDGVTLPDPEVAAYPSTGNWADWMGTAGVAPSRRGYNLKAYGRALFPQLELKLECLSLRPISLELGATVPINRGSCYLRKVAHTRRWSIPPHVRAGFGYLHMRSMSWEGLLLGVR